MEYIIFGSACTFIYTLYKIYDATNDIEDNYDKINEWEERCLSAGIMLPY